MSDRTPCPADDGNESPVDSDVEHLHPWDRDPPPDDPDAPRARIDAFTPKRRNEFLRALVKHGCLADAARDVGVSTKTVYRHQQRDDEFMQMCNVAFRMREVPLELTAWQRAVDGVAEQIVVGGQVRTRVRYSESLLRLMLQGSNPKKYGPRPGFGRKRLLKAERKQMEREVRAELAAEAKAKEEKWSFEDAMTLLESKMKIMGMLDDQPKLERGWTKAPDGYLIPPGYAWAGGPEGPPAHFDYGLNEVSDEELRNARLPKSV